jgi:hypothetical protein
MSFAMLSILNIACEGRLNKEFHILLNVHLVMILGK